MQSILPKFDDTVDVRRVGLPSEETDAIPSASVLAQIEPENFLTHVTWHISSDINDMFIDPPLESPASCFHAPIWIKSWAKTIEADQHVSIKILVGSVAGVPVIAMPMCSISTGLLTRIQFFGQDVCDYNTPVLHQGLTHLSPLQLMDFVCREAPRLFPDADCLDLRKCLFETDASSGKGFHWLEEPDSAHLSHLSGEWSDDLSQFIGKSSRRSLKRKLKKLQSMGNVVFREPVTSEQKKTAIETLIEWKSEQLKQLGTAHIFQNRNFRDLLAEAALKDESGMVRVFGMYLDGSPIALTLMLCRKNRWFLYQTAYTSEDPGKYSPGYLLLLHIMEEASGKNVPVFDFGWGNESYKARFATANQPLYRTYIPLSLKGRMSRHFFDAKIRVKELVKSNRYTHSLATFMLRAMAALKRN